MTNKEFIAYLNTASCRESIIEHTKKLIAVYEEAKDYVEGRSVNMGTLELEDAIDKLEKE